MINIFVFFSVLWWMYLVAWWYVYNFPSVWYILKWEGSMPWWAKLMTVGTMGVYIYWGATLYYG